MPFGTTSFTLDLGPLFPEGLEVETFLMQTLEECQLCDSWNPEREPEKRQKKCKL